MIRDVQLPDSPQVAFYCDFDRCCSLPDVYSRGNYMRVEFIAKSNYEVTRGFKARYEASHFCKYYSLLVNANVRLIQTYCSRLF